MKHEETRPFVRDWARLSRPERARFISLLHSESQPACDRFAQEPTTPWPRGLRVKGVQGSARIWEMTWSFAGLDGRATFEWIGIDGELAIRWRRIGGHEAFGRP